MLRLGKLVGPQSWKLWLCALLLAFAGVASFASSPVGRIIGVEPALVGLVASALALVVFSLAAWSIACPSCGLRLAWYAVSKKPLGQWLSWLLDAESCPRCHHAGKAAQRVA